MKEHHMKEGKGKAMHHGTSLDKTGSMERKSLTNNGNEPYKIGHGGSLGHYLKDRGISKGY